MLTFHLLDPADIPWQHLDSCSDRTVFQTREWLDFIAETQSAQPVIAELRDGSDVAGYFSGCVFRRLGVRILGSSFPGWTTPYVGFNLCPGVSRRAALQALENFAFGPMKCLHLEVSDRYFSAEDAEGLGFLRRFYDSYETDLSQSDDEIFNKMNSTCRRCIRKAEKSGVLIEEASDPAFAAEYWAQLEDVFAKQGLVPSYNLARVQALIKHLLPTGRLLLLRARDPSGNCIGTGIYPAYNQIAEFWGNAS